jgi:hypothetical protein
MDEPTKPFEILQQLLDKILALLAGVGIELPPIVVQSFLLVLVLAVISLFLPKPKEWRSKPLPTLGVVAVALVACGIFFTWIQQASTTFPDELVGTIIIDNGTSPASYNKMYVELADGKGHKLSTGTSYVDSENKTVLIYYQPSVGNLPKKILVKAPACEPGEHEYGIELRELTAGEFTRHLTCRES